MNLYNDINERIALIKSDKTLADEFIIEYTPFLKALIRKYTIAKEKSFDYDDFLNIARAGFYEACLSFSSEKGYFISFATLVVKRRLYNYIKKHEKNKKETAFSSMNQNNSEGKEIEFQVKDESPSYFDNPYKLEIEAIKQECLQYGIDFIKLENHSPKSEKTKKSCEIAINFMLKNVALISKMRKYNQLPIKIIVEKCNINRKIIERHRQYIMVAIIIAEGDYPFIAGYLNLQRGEVKL